EESGGAVGVRGSGRYSPDRDGISEVRGRALGVVASPGTALARRRHRRLDEFGTERGDEPDPDLSRSDGPNDLRLDPPEFRDVVDQDAEASAVGDDPIKVEQGAPGADVE